MLIGGVWMRKSARRLSALLASTVLLAGCALILGPPGPTTQQNRLAMIPTTDLPVSAPVTVRWSPEMVPFVEAGTDADAAFALGLVHAHLRLGQMAVARRVVQGRISESAGPFTTDIDVAIRAFDFGRATDRIYAEMPEESQRWLDRYVEGINHYAARLPRNAWPHEFAALDIDWEPWTVQDSLTLDRVVEAIHPAIGTMILKHWHFADELVAASGDGSDQMLMAGLTEQFENILAVMRSIATGREKVAMVNAESRSGPSKSMMLLRTT